MKIVRQGATYLIKCISTYTCKMPDNKLPMSYVKYTST